MYCFFKMGTRTLRGAFMETHCLKTMFPIRIYTHCLGHDMWSFSDYRLPCFCMIEQYVVCIMWKWKILSYYNCVQCPVIHRRLAFVDARAGNLCGFFLQHFFSFILGWLHLLCRPVIAPLPTLAHLQGPCAVNPLQPCGSLHLGYRLFSSFHFDLHLCPWVENISPCLKRPCWTDQQESQLCYTTFPLLLDSLGRLTFRE